MQLSVGLTAFSGHIQRYADRFDLLEFRFDPEKPPSARSLKRLRGTAPAGLTFCILSVPSLTAGALQDPERLALVLETAEILKAPWLVLQTGPEVGPSSRVRARLAALARQAEGHGHRIAWEPRGPWEPEVAREFAGQSGIIFVEDLSMVEAPPSRTIYTRLRVPGPGAGLRGGALEKLARQIRDAEECFVVIEGRASGHARSRIRQAVAASGDEYGSALVWEEEEPLDESSDGESWDEPAEGGGDDSELLESDDGKSSGSAWGEDDHDQDDSEERRR